MTITCFSCIDITMARIVWNYVVFDFLETLGAFFTCLLNSSNCFRIPISRSRSKNNFVWKRRYQVICIVLILDNFMPAFSKIHYIRTNAITEFFYNFPDFTIPTTFT